MPFFTFNQNNAGGRFEFDADRGITEYVVVESKNQTGAIRRAKKIGIELGVYRCDCCDPPWTHPDAPTDTPIVDEQDVRGQGRLLGWYTDRDIPAAHVVCVHPLRGGLEWYPGVTREEFRREEQAAELRAAMPAWMIEAASWINGVPYLPHPKIEAMPREAADGMVKALARAVAAVDAAHLDGFPRVLDLPWAHAVARWLDDGMDIEGIVSHSGLTQEQAIKLSRISGRVKVSRISLWDYEKTVMDFAESARAMGLIVSDEQGDAAAHPITARRWLRLSDDPSYRDVRSRQAARKKLPQTDVRDKRGH